MTKISYLWLVCKVKQEWKINRVKSSSFVFALKRILFPHSQFPLRDENIVETDLISCQQSNKIIFYLRNNENNCKNNPYSSSSPLFLKRNDDLLSRKRIFSTSVFTRPSMNWILEFWLVEKLFWWRKSTCYRFVKSIVYGKVVGMNVLFTCV